MITIAFYSESSFLFWASETLGICEERSKMYARYFAQVLEQITTRITANIGGVDGFAVKQTNATRRKA